MHICGLKMTSKITLKCSNYLQHYEATPVKVIIDLTRTFNFDASKAHKSSLFKQSKLKCMYCNSYSNLYTDIYFGMSRIEKTTFNKGYLEYLMLSLCPLFDQLQNIISHFSFLNEVNTLC